MRRLSCLFALIMFTAAAGSVSAAPIDPEIGIDGDPTGPTPVTSNTFTFGADSLGGGKPQFVNDAGFTFVSLTFSVVLPQGSIIKCTPGPIFAACLISSLDIRNTDNAIFHIGFETGPGALTGILPGAPFRVLLNNSGSPDAGGWGAGNDFNAVAGGAAPEPSSFGLLGIAVGAGAIAFYRRRTAA